MTTSKDNTANRLIHEKSPYLQQHAYNPVDWYPWGEEAFAKAAAEDKPVFLSIGYSTCHWCHVMEHESFEDDSVSALMNQYFVNIKVDREERPDVDDVYITVCQMMTGSGGWPLTILMTPDRRPFFAATYIPKSSRHNRPGMLDLLPRIHHMWNTNRGRILKSAESIHEHLQKTTMPSAGGKPDESYLHEAYTQFESTFDEAHGGFNLRPKFPTPHNLMFLLRYYHRTGEKHALKMVEKTLTEMRRGGLFDHIGKGFHRYSTDEHWLLPHFEKMLYDQAMLVFANLEAWQVTQNPLFRTTAEEILAYVSRDMTAEGGGFFTAEDADSEGVEGKFYVWEKREILEVLGEREGEWLSAIFNIEVQGNFHEEATGEQQATNIPHLTKSYAEWADSLGMAESEFRERVDGELQKLFQHREKRIHPLKDDKVLTDWNGLMIAAFARAAIVLNNDDYLRAAGNAFGFIEQTMIDNGGGLLHRFRDNEAGISGFLDDYAFLIWGALELFEASGDPRYLQRAIDLAEIVRRDFADHQNGGFFLTANDAEEMLVRKKQIYDGAIPSANSVMLLNLLRLARQTGDEAWENLADMTASAFAADVRHYPAGYTFYLAALDFMTGPSYEIVVSAADEGQITREQLRKLQQPFVPNKVILLKTPETAAAIAVLAPYSAEMMPGDGHNQIFVCLDFACQLPVKTAAEALKILGR